MLVLAVAVTTECQTKTDAAPQTGTEADPEPSESSSLEESPSASPGQAEAEGVPEDLLLPNMRSLSPTDLRVDTEQGQVRLRFAGLLANVDNGPMLVNAAGVQNCPPAQRPAVQVIHRDTSGDGTFQRQQDPIGVRSPGRMHARPPRPRPLALRLGGVRLIIPTAPPVVRRFEG